MRLLPEEPDLGTWQAVPVSAVVDAVRSSRVHGRETLVAVDGRSASGKSTVADVLAAHPRDADEQAVVVHTDDVAWHQARFDWVDLLTDHVLTPSPAGHAVHWRPPAWIEHGRVGAIEVSADTTLLLVEGVGAARRQLIRLFDLTVWVQSDIDAAHDRGIARDRILHGRSQVDAEAERHAWMAEELPHLATDRPWERADLVVAGTDVGVHAGQEDLIVATRSPLLQR